QPPDPGRIRRDGAPHRAAGTGRDPGGLRGLGEAERQGERRRSMSELEVTIVNRLGLHARAAAKFVHLAGAFVSRVTVSKDGTRVDGKSILGLLTLAASKGTK